MPHGADDEDHIVHDFGIVVLDVEARTQRRLDWDHRDVAEVLAR